MRADRGFRASFGPRPTRGWAPRVDTKPLQRHLHLPRPSLPVALASPRSSRSPPEQPDQGRGTPARWPTVRASAPLGVGSGCAHESAQPDGLRLPPSSATGGLATTSAYPRRHPWPATPADQLLLRHAASSARREPGPRQPATDIGACTYIAIALRPTTTFGLAAGFFLLGQEVFSPRFSRWVGTCYPSALGSGS